MACIMCLELPLGTSATPRLKGGDAMDAYVTYGVLFAIMTLILAVIALCLQHRDK